MFDDKGLKNSPLFVKGFILLSVLNTLVSEIFVMVSLISPHFTRHFVVTYFYFHDGQHSKHIFNIAQLFLAAITFCDILLVYFGHKYSHGGAIGTCALAG